MENFIVSARKYRPQNFAAVVGQSHITTTLKNAIRNKQLAHAFLFCGPRGVGKTTCARILAKTINCENLQSDGEACNQCSSCHSFNEGSSFNIHELDAASNNSVDDIRTLTDQVRFAPQSGKYKIYIIDEVHMLSTAAFNAFLKTLEEPPSYAIFILATTEKHKILPTILSRCQLFDFRRITIQDTVDHLQEICSKENITADPDALHLIAQKSEGCMRDSLSILDKIVSFTNGHLTYRNTLDHLNILDYDYYFRVMEAVQRQDMAEVLLIVDEILQKGFEGDNFIGGMAEFIRDLLVCKDEKVIQLLEISANLKERYKTLATTMNAALLVSALQLLTDAEINYRQARNKRLLVEITMIKLCYLEQAVSLVSNDQTGEVIKKKLTEPAVTQKLRAAFPKPLQTSSPDISSRTEPEARLTIAEEKTVPAVDIAAPKAGIPEAVTNKEPAGNNRLTGLKNLRSKISRQSATNVPVSTVPITPGVLAEKWEEYARKLQATNRQNIASNLLNARVALTGEEEITIISKNIIQQKFIEEEKVDIAEFLKQALQHPQLILMLQLDEDAQETAAMPVVLSGKEQYLRMIEKYPLVKELKDKLNLEIDY